MTNLTQRLEAKAAQMESKGYKEMADLLREAARELKQNSLTFVGYTNGHQIAYAKEDEGAFYPNTENECYIPLYMLEVHERRLYGTPSDPTNKENEQANKLKGGK